MNRDERFVERFLQSLNLGEVVHEPDGGVPPDFSVGGQIAVEVRRLNQSYEKNGERRGLEEDTIPIRQGLQNLLAEFQPTDERAWFVMFKCRRPLPEWRHLRAHVRHVLHGFLRHPAGTPTLRVTDTFSMTLFPAQEGDGKQFLFGGFTDANMGGWVVSEIITNMSVYIADKTRKVAPYRSKYAAWWLIFVDYIGTPSEEAEVRKHLQRPPAWNRVIVLNPSSGRAYDI